MYQHCLPEDFIIENKLGNDALELSELAKDLIARSKPLTVVKRAKTTRCALLINPKEAKKFLDKPAEFKDPLKDAFDQHMRLLAA